MNDSGNAEGIKIRRLSPEEFVRLAEVERKERVRVGYRMSNGKLERMDVHWDSSNWRPEGPEHSVECFVHELNKYHDRGSTTLGAFDGDRLVAVATWRPNLTKTMDQLAFLHVSHGYRRRGIGSLLCDRLEALARDNGAHTFYVSATPSESAVGFYMGRGFAPTVTPHPELFELEPEDIHMTKELAN